jgi:hypothetical protein
LICSFKEEVPLGIHERLQKQSDFLLHIHHSFVELVYTQRHLLLE